MLACVINDDALRTIVLLILIDIIQVFTEAKAVEKKQARQILDRIYVKNGE